MVGRPVNEQRRDELLDAVVGYAIERGLAAVTWRPLAAALGVTPTTLVHRFGSKEQMIEEIQARLRERILTETLPADDEDTTLVEYARRVWARVSETAREREFRLFFAVYGQALQTPDAFAGFLDQVVTAPLDAFAARRSESPDARSTATLLVAVLRGLMLDLLTTGDRDRVGAAADTFFTAMEQAPAR